VISSDNDEYDMDKLTKYETIFLFGTLLDERSLSKSSGETVVSIGQKAKWSHIANR